MSNPLVSVGMTAFNQCRFLPEAIESILAQTYPNFELIISDNASEDDTREICLAYQGQDARINYTRNDYNRGSIYNGNKVRDLARGKYFMWASDHDLRHPDFIRRAVEIMEADPEIALTYARVQRIDVDGNVLALGPDTMDTRGLHPAVRYMIIVAQHCGGDLIYGLFNRETMLKVQPKPVWVSDMAFLAGLAFHGTFAHIPEPMLSMRVIRDETMDNHRRTQAYNLDPARTEEILSMEWPELWRELGVECLSHVSSSGISSEEKNYLVAGTKLCFKERFGVEL